MRPILLYLLFISFLSCTSKVNNDLARIKLTELDNQNIDLAQYKGKTVFINFWATWCKPCIQEMPTIERAKVILKDKRGSFPFASNEDIEDIRKFMSKRAYDFHYVHSENLEELKIQALPTTFIFNSEGKVIFSEAGFRKWDDPSSIELINKIVNNHEN